MKIVELFVLSKLKEVDELSKQLQHGEDGANIITNAKLQMLNKPIINEMVRISFTILLLKGVLRE